MKTKKPTKYRLIDVLENDINLLKIKFPWDKQILNEVKKIPGRRYDADNKQWVIPYSPAVIKDLVDRLDFITGDKLKAELNAKMLKKAKNLKIPKLLKTPYPFQKIGITKLIDKNGISLLADDMGLGKTLQTIGWLAKKTLKKLPVIIICPASLKLNWKKELESTLPNCPKIQIIDGMYKGGAILDSSIYIINYTIFSNSFEKIEMPDGSKKMKELKGTGWVDILLELNPKTVIIDEAHAIKNKDTNRTKSIMKLKNCKHRILLTGTPIEKRPVELWNLIDFLNPKLFTNYYSYVFRYCAAKKDNYGLDVSGASNLNELHKILTNTIMIRRTKEEVGIELPKRMDSIISVEITNREEYQQAEKHFKMWLIDKLGKELDAVEKQLSFDFGEQHKTNIIKDKVSKTLSAEILVKIGVLKQLAAQGKIDAIIDWIKANLPNEEKMVVFCTHKIPIEKLYSKFKNIAVKIDGSVAAEKRQGIVEEFQNNNKIKLFFGNMKAAGVGITLTAASNVVIAEYPDKPGELTQAIDRINRIGQKSENINVWFFEAANTIEADLIDSLNHEQKIVKNVLDGIAPEETILIDKLLSKFLK